MENPESKRPLGKPGRKREDNIEMDLREIWWGGMDWLHLAQNRNHFFLKSTKGESMFTPCSLWISLWGKSVHLRCIGSSSEKNQTNGEMYITRKFVVYKRNRVLWDVTSCIFVGRYLDESLSIKVHGVVTKKSAILKFTVVRTQNLI
jgi:hypothetical protein